jgi:hypothetical protein
VGAAKFSRILENQGLVGAYMSIRNRMNLALFSRSVNVLKENTVLDDREILMSSVYQTIMAEAYPHLSSPKSKEKGDGLYSNRYKELGERYKNSRHWLEFVNKFSWNSLFLLTGGSLKLHDYQILSMSNGLFMGLLEMLEKEKGSFVKLLCSGMSSVINVSKDGAFQLGKGQAIIESTDDATSRCWWISLLI